MAERQYNSVRPGMDIEEIRVLRPAINMLMLFAPPLSPLPRMKSNREQSMTGFLPKIVASEPVHGRNAVAARLYELITQIKSLPWRSATMVGSAVDTMSYARGVC